MSTTPPAPEPRATEAVFDRLMAGILGGDYPPRSTLPAERELASTLGTSRPTLRAALRRLAGWNVVAARGGSGVVVLDRREWTVEVLPAYLRFGTGDMGGAERIELVRELLRLRRVLVREILGVVATRVRPERIPAARSAFRRAWQSRGDAERFPQDDLDAIRITVEAADFVPAVWLLNRLAGVYHDVGRLLPGAATPPEDYLTTHEGLLDAIGRGDRAATVAIMDAYLVDHDRRLLSSLEGTQ